MLDGIPSVLSRDSGVSLSSLWKSLQPFLIVALGAILAQRLAAGYQRRHTVWEVRRKALLDFNDVFSRIVIATMQATRGFPDRRLSEAGRPVVFDTMTIDLDTEFMLLYRQLLGMLIYLDFFRNGDEMVPKFNAMIGELEKATQISRADLDTMLATPKGFPEFIDQRIKAATKNFTDMLYMMAREVTPLTIRDRIRQLQNC
jgi:hypothetical protein